jgi:hypothetical protein
MGSRASNCGLVKFDCTGRVLQFFEKPMGADLESMVSNSLSTYFVSFVFSEPLFSWSILLVLFRIDYLFCYRMKV